MNPLTRGINRVPEPRDLIADLKDSQNQLIKPSPTDPKGPAQVSPSPSNLGHTEQGLTAAEVAIDVASLFSETIGGFATGLKYGVEAGRSPYTDLENLIGGFTDAEGAGTPGPVDPFPVDSPPANSTGLDGGFSCGNSSGGVIHGEPIEEKD